MYSTRKRKNEKNVDLFAVVGIYLRDLSISYIRYDTLRKALQRTQDAMHVLILIYVYRTSYFSRIIFRTRDFFKIDLFPNVEIFIIFELLNSSYE